jgi:cell shape-determining protein MreD
MTVRESARVTLVVALFVTVQETVVLDLRVGGIHPDIMILLPIVAGLVGGPGSGASMGFGAGLVADLFLPTPFGLSALVGCLIGFTVGVTTLALDRTAWWLAPTVALGGSAIYEVLYLDLTQIVVVVSLVNAVLALPAVRLVSWALPQASTEGVPTSTVSSGTLR